MAKGDVWYLRHTEDNNSIVAKIEITEDYCAGNCYKTCSWNGDNNEPVDWHYVTGFYCKWNSCTHWYFRGEDYDKEFTESLDSYYHLCGSPCFADHIRNMCFVWKVASMILIERHKDSKYLKSEITDNYFDNGTTKLIELMLDGYTIEKEEKKS